LSGLQVMFQSWRVQLRKAENAFADGRLEEATELLLGGTLNDYLPGKQLASKVALALAERARKQLIVDGNTDAGWQDIATAESVGGDTREIQIRRREMISYTLRQAEEMMRSLRSDEAMRCLEQLERRKPNNDDLRRLKEVARRLESARHLSAKGKFAGADTQLAAAVDLRKDLDFVEQQRKECRYKLEQYRELTERLHKVMSEKNWTKAVRVAEEILEIAPENRLARDARKRAWKEVGTDVVDSHRVSDTDYYRPEKKVDAFSGMVRSSRTTNRFLLWVDAVGGYLVCLDDEVVIGQSCPDNDVHIPIQADLARKHAVIRRNGEDYLIDPVQKVIVDGKPITTTAILTDGDEFELGAGVRIRFRRPHALSGTARLEILSRHRTHPYTDSILLMAESCVMGPNWQNHVVCRDWRDDVVIFRQDTGLCCRAMASVEIDGLHCDGRGRITYNSHIAGDDFSMTLEQI
jgi:tetratricopeptide (TPR) repeat protein